MFQRIKPDEFYSQFRKLCRDYVKGFCCEALASCVQQFEGILEHNRNTIDDPMVAEIFHIFLDEYRDECVRRIEEFGKYCRR